jgi:hypothetical protein
MTNSHEIKEKVKETYANVALTGDSCCDPLGSGGNKQLCNQSNNRQSKDIQ